MQDTSVTLFKTFVQKVARLPLTIIDMMNDGEEEEKTEETPMEAAPEEAAPAEGEEEAAV